MDSWYCDVDRIGRGNRGGTLEDSFWKTDAVVASYRVSELHIAAGLKGHFVGGQTFVFASVRQNPYYIFIFLQGSLNKTSMEYNTRRRRFRSRYTLFEKSEFYSGSDGQLI